MYKHKALAFVLQFFVSFILLIGAYFLSAYYQHQQSSALLSEKIKNRIALDLEYVNLPDPFLSHAGSEEMVIAYIDELNTLLGKESAVTLYAIENIKSKPKINPAQITREVLLTPKRSVELFLIYNGRKLSWLDFIFITVSLIAAAGLAYGWRYTDPLLTKTQSAPTNDAPMASLTPILLIDLQNKSLANSTAIEKQVHLANKPLCFYLALIEFCIENPEVTLNQNKDVPEPLIELANKYFYRLIELGHTIRKRPNFTNSLEKTLSEIRAALDEALADYPELKERYYPPKAHGEGSRSRLHSYGLAHISVNDIEVIGK